MDEALATVEAAIELVERTDQRFHEPELRRLRGELLLAVEPARSVEAETELHAALAVARGQGAAAFEQRAAESLRRLQARS